PYIKAFLFLGLVFDASAFLIILIITIKGSRYHQIMPLMKAIQRNRAIYFLVLFTSNLLWIFLLFNACV
ncbi:hypothetical protein BDZ94DRAFT_1135770, partial [Collybia nuda]